MRSAALRWTIFSLFVAALIAAAYVFWSTESTSRSVSASADDFREHTKAAKRAVVELRMAQQAYVAAGQGDEFWGSKVGTQIGSVREELTWLRAHASSAPAQGDIDEAIAALADFERMDARAREYTRGRQLLLASDLIFSDGLDKTTAVLQSLERAETMETAVASEVVRAARRRELALIGGIVAAALALGLVLAPAPRLPAAEMPLSVAVPGDRSEARERSEEGEKDALVLRDVRDPLPPVPAETPLAMRDARTEPRDLLDLNRVASLCTELSRVVDTRSLPMVLERTALVLDASGVVLWIADPDGRELNPIVAHGYPQQVVTRLGTIPREAPNATAAAFRTSLLQTVHADTISNGAIAVPLLTPAGCVGVMAAEVRHGGETQDAKLAAAAIVAAQLATLVGPPSSRTQGRPEAVRA